MLFYFHAYLLILSTIFSHWVLSWASSIQFSGDYIKNYNCDVSSGHLSSLSYLCFPIHLMISFSFSSYSPFAFYPFSSCFPSFILLLIIFLLILDRSSSLLLLLLFHCLYRLMVLSYLCLPNFP